MTQINPHFSKMKDNYLFAEISSRLKAYKSNHPDAHIVDLGIGDVTRPIAPAIVSAMHQAVDEMSDIKGFRGYGPYFGYDFLRKAICQNDYIDRGIEMSEDSIFVSDGCKSDCGNIGDIFGPDNKVMVCDPVYPVYVDTAVMSGRSGEYNPENQSWSGVKTLSCNPDNEFVPNPPQRVSGDMHQMLYLCFPNNPTGAVASFDKLKKWVEYAKDTQSIIIYDSAYEAFIRGNYPRSIFEIEGAKSCAIEMRSFSKTAGFTGIRCGYTVICEELKVEGIALKDLWKRRQSTKFNGVSYVTQRAAEAVYSVEGKKQIRANLDFYMENATLLRSGLKKSGFEVYGGENAPYIWVRTPSGVSSWSFFDILLNEHALVATPGSGFGAAGEGYFRVTAFGSREDSEEAVRRFSQIQV